MAYTITQQSYHSYARYSGAENRHGAAQKHPRQGGYHDTRF